MACYLITGGTGLIGSELAKKLISKKHEVIILTRDKSVASSKLGVGFQFVEAFSEISTEKAIDVIINLAGEPIAEKRWTEEQKSKIWQSRVGLTEQLITFIESLETKPKSLISGSAVGYYGDCGDSLVTEKSEPHQEYTHELCKAWENAALKAQAYDVKVCLIRTGLVMSSHGGFISKMMLPFKLGLGGPIGSGEQFMPWIHIDDMIAAIEYLIDNTLEGSFNLTAPKPVTNKAFSESFAKQLRRPCLLFTPAFVLKLMFGDMSRLLLTGQNAVPERLIENGFRFSYPSLRSAFDALD